MKYKMKDKRKRNQSLIKFAEEHPNHTQEAIAKIYHVSRSRVSRILKKGADNE